MWVTLYFFVHTAADATMFEDNLGSSSILERLSLLDRFAHFTIIDTAVNISVVTEGQDFLSAEDRDIESLFFLCFSALLSEFPTLES